MENYESIDVKIQKGYELILEHNTPGGCDKWLCAWADIKELLTKGIAKDIYDLDGKYEWTQYISNYVQDMEMELHNAGLKDKTYHAKRAVYCQELLQWCGTEETIVSNTRRGMAEGYFLSGEAAKGEQLFIEWLQQDPDWGWGYIGWSDCYRLSAQNDRAEEILLNGLARESLRDRIDVVERMVILYKNMGKPDKVKEYKKKLVKLSRLEPSDSHYYRATPVKADKIGRNAPCPCGSGKKYKKCCGA